MLVLLLLSLLLLLRPRNWLTTALEVSSSSSGIIYVTTVFSQKCVNSNSLLFSSFADSSGIVENSNPLKKVTKEAVDLLTKDEEDQVKKRSVVKPVKKRPKSEGFELFEKKEIVIGVVSGFFISLFLLGTCQASHGEICDKMMKQS